MLRAEPETVKTPIGDLTFTHDFVHGYLDKESVEKLYEEIGSLMATDKTQRV